MQVHMYPTIEKTHTGTCIYMKVHAHVYSVPFIALCSPLLAIPGGGILAVVSVTLAPDWPLLGNESLLLGNAFSCWVASLVGTDRIPESLSAA